MKRFLITTALEDTWVDDEPVLFLGEWCRLYSRRNRWSSMNAEVLPWHWNDQDKFYADYQYLGEFYERALLLLADRLNNAHDIDKEVRYWRVLAGPWLARFIQTFFDRWSSIHQALARCEISGTIIRTGQDCVWAPSDTQQLGLQIAGDDWNHHIYAAILERFTEVPCTKRAHTQTASVSKRGRVGIRDRVATRYTGLARHLVRDNDAFFIGTYLDVLDDVRLQFRLGQCPQFWQSPPVARVPTDWQQRQWTMERDGRAPFEVFVLSMLPKHIPAPYLEGFRELNELVSGLPWPAQPKLIFTSNALWHDTVSMAYTAEKVTQGTPLVYGQHGGMSGEVRFNFGEEHEVAISDRYLSWGWDVEGQPKIKPVGILKTPRTFRRTSNSKQTLLLVTFDAPRYSSRLFSGLLALTDSYYDNCLLFAESLPARVRKELLVRHTSYDHGRSQGARWRERFPDVALDPGRLLMNDLLKEARLAVYTYNSTGHLEAFARDIPAVLFWDPEVNLLRDDAVAYFDDLRRVGILHDTPESAAGHIAAIWDDVDAWWASPSVRTVLARFKARYCHVPDSLLDRLETIFSEVAAEKKYLRMQRSADNITPKCNSTLRHRG